MITHDSIWSPMHVTLGLSDVNIQYSTVVLSLLPSKHIKMADPSPLYQPLGQILYGLNRPPVSSWDSAIGIWAGCLTKLGESSQRPSILSRLSAPQRTCLLVLEEWWWYWCEDRIRYAISSHVTEQPTLPLDPTGIACVPQRKLYELWAWEFFETGNINEIGDLILAATHTRVRRSAVEAAAVHRTALAVFSSLLHNSTQSNLESIPDAHKSLQNRLGHHIPACVEPCPWIPKSGGGDEYPYYLWDKEERRTVHFEENVPPYSVISHTWGRFRIPGKESAIPNVPWPVPCLDPKLLFDIQTLPEILSRFPVSTRYIWFDLVCIPQDGRPLQNIEIGRQAGIFQAARFAVVWLNQVEDWSGLRSAVLWSSIEYLSRYQNDIYQVSGQLPATTQLASRNLGLTRPAAQIAEGTPEAPWVFENRNDQTVTPDRWFTSLWTLQEACLRPDMILCNKNWDIFSVQSKDEQIPILLDHIIALLSRPAAPRLPYVPAAVDDLSMILGSSRMSGLLIMTPVDILGLGQMRYCANTDRAVAIMSALGVTDWFNGGGHDSEPQPENLVGGQYPLEFLHEFHRRFGSIMFATTDASALDETFYESPELLSADVECLKGSMLPFNRSMQEPKVTGVEIICPIDHPTVRNWSIEQNGSVKMKSVCIIASSHGPNKHPIMATIFPRRMRTPNLEDLVLRMRSFRPHSEKYAVCLMCNMRTIYRGAILERVHPHKDVFLNVGSFYADEQPPLLSKDKFEEQTSVDWIVL